MKEFSTILASAAVLLCCVYSSEISFKSQKLTHIDVKAIQNSGSKDVYLQDNLLDSFDSDLCTIVPQIELLQVSQNQLQTLDVSSCIGLKHLYAYINKLTSVNLSKPSSLEEIDLSRNELKILPDLSPATKLRYLNLAHNKIDHLATGVFDENLNLSVLDLSHNLLAHLTDNVFATSGNLEKLFMDNNSISALPDSIFQFCPKLKIVSLSHNYIRTIKPSLFSSNSLLFRLDISSNKLEEMELPKDLPRLVFLDASNNNLFNVSLPQHLRRLRKVDFSYNALTQVSDQLVGSTGASFYLDLSNNNISIADVDSFDLRTKTILLDGNPLLCHGDKLSDTRKFQTDESNQRVLPMRPILPHPPSLMSCSPSHMKGSRTGSQPTQKSMKKTWLFRSFMFLVKLQIAGTVVYFTAKNQIWKDSEATAQLYEKIKAKFTETDSVKTQTDEETEEFKKRLITTWNATVKKIAYFLTWKTK